MGVTGVNKELMDAYFALAETPGSHAAWERLGDIYFEKQLFSKAESCYIGAIRTLEKLSEAEIIALPVFEKARTAFERASNDFAYKAYLDVIEDLSRGADPVTLYTETQDLLQKYPTSAYVQHIHGTVCQLCACRIQNADCICEGIHAYEKASLIDPSEPSYILILADLYLMGFNFEKARAALEEARILMDANASLSIANQPVELLERQCCQIHDNLSEVIKTSRSQTQGHRLSFR